MSCQFVKRVVCESLEVLGDSREHHPTIGAAGDNVFLPAQVDQPGDSGNEKNLKQVDCKKTEPDMDDTEPGTDEGAWEKK